MRYLSSYTEGEDIHHLHIEHTPSQLILYRSTHFYSHREADFGQPHSLQFVALILHSSNLWASIVILLELSFLQIGIKVFAGKVLWPFSWSCPFFSQDELWFEPAHLACQLTYERCQAHRQADRIQWAGGRSCPRPWSGRAVVWASWSSFCSSSKSSQPLKSPGHAEQTCM